MFDLCIMFDLYIKRNRFVVEKLLGNYQSFTQVIDKMYSNEHNVLVF